MLGNTWKSFHFQENNVFISFPSQGNEGRKYLYYKVKVKKLGETEEMDTCLAEVVGAQQFEDCYPYTVGFFKGPLEKVNSSTLAYLEIRKVSCLEDFWKFLNDLNI